MQQGGEEEGEGLVLEYFRKVEALVKDFGLSKIVLRKNSFELLQKFFLHNCSCDASEIEREYVILRNGKYGQTHKY